MILKCSKCGVVLTEEGTEEEAVPELVRRLNRHFARRHPKTVERVDQVIAELVIILEGYVKLTEYADVEEDSPIGEVEGQLLDQLGVSLGFFEDEEVEEEIEGVVDNDDKPDSEVT